MTINKPNRTREQSEGSNEKRRKQSGDQHLFPTDEPSMDPHRPHRISREDMQQNFSGESSQDESS